MGFPDFPIQVLVVGECGFLPELESHADFPMAAVPGFTTGRGRAGFIEDISILVLPLAEGDWQTLLAEGAYRNLMIMDEPGLAGEIFDLAQKFKLRIRKTSCNPECAGEMLRWIRKIDRER